MLSLCRLELELGKPQKNLFVTISNKNYSTLDNLSKYGHIMLKFVGMYYYWVVTIKNMAILVQKLRGKKIVKPRFRLFHEKNPMAIKAWAGGGKVLMTRPLKKSLFFAASLSEGNILKQNDDNA